MGHDQKKGGLGKIRQYQALEVRKDGQILSNNFEKTLFAGF